MISEPGRPAVGAAERDLARRFADALAADDIDGVVALPTDDAWLAMPPEPPRVPRACSRGRFLAGRHPGAGTPSVPAPPPPANGRPGFGCYLADPDGSAAQPAGIVVLTTDGARISAVSRFLDPQLPARFGLVGPPADEPMAPDTPSDGPSPG